MRIQQLVDNDDDDDDDASPGARTGALHHQSDSDGQSQSGGSRAHGPVLLQTPAAAGLAKQLMITLNVPPPFNSLCQCSNQWCTAILAETEAKQTDQRNRNKTKQTRPNQPSTN